ncbi:hypothetical protein D9M72_282100 [compost metagenome]
MPLSPPILPEKRCAISASRSPEPKRKPATKTDTTKLSTSAPMLAILPSALLPACTSEGSSLLRRASKLSDAMLQAA